MLDALNKFMKHRSQEQVVVIGLLLICFVAALDQLTGYELSFSIFYLIPIVLVTWYSQRWLGFLASLFSAIFWLVVDYTSGRPYSNLFIPIWNAAVRLGFFLVTTFLLCELKALLRSAEALARIDSLTSVLNSRGFKEIADHLLKLAARHKHPVALGYIDIDDFKKVNDTQGHAAGDRLLEAVASAIKRTIRSTDVAGRLGGDEFSILMPETGSSGARTAFEKLFNELTHVAEAYDAPVGYSIGVVVFTQAPPELDQALSIADHIMYRVKKLGKNRVFIEEHD